mmetsp:Transcript_120218/g.347424  ORF Transcript_120218/g.347424 Transcript_120218/m.347424 type:complete len:200 (+) Transcript_120218:559-1158(+)
MISLPSQMWEKTAPTDTHTMKAALMRKKFALALIARLSFREKLASVLSNSMMSAICTPFLKLDNLFFAADNTVAARIRRSGGEPFSNLSIKSCTSLGSGYVARISSLAYCGCINIISRTCGIVRSCAPSVCRARQAFKRRCSALERKLCCLLSINEMKRLSAPPMNDEPARMWKQLYAFDTAWFSESNPNPIESPVCTE